MRIAALQMNSGTRPGPNLDSLERLAKEAAAQGAVYALSPEVTVVYAENADGLRPVAEPWDGNSAIDRCAQIARDTRLWLHLGSLAVTLADGRFANRSVLFAPDGSIRATYDRSICSMRFCQACANIAKAPHTPVATAQSSLTPPV